MERLSSCEEEVFVCVCRACEPPALEDVRSVVNLSKGHDWKPQTVSTFLQRTVKKGYLKMERKGRYCYYYPLLDLREYQKMRLLEMKRDLFNNDFQLMRKCLTEIEKPD